MSTLKIRENSSSPWQSIPTGGVGVPAGGTTNQFLIKSSNVNYATQWSTVIPATIGAMAEWDLLWENASPTSSFAAQTLNISLTNYDLVLCVFRNGSENDNASVIIPVGVDGVLIVPHESGSGGNKYRTFSPTTSGIAIGDGKTGGTGTVNTNNIPRLIYGIKGVHSS